MNKGQTSLPLLDLSVDSILLKADKSPHAMTYSSSLSGVAYAISKDGGILILDKHGFFGKKVEDMRVIKEELEYVMEEAERFQRA